VIQLTAKNYSDYLSSRPADDRLVIEYYASWCPHCRHFAPTYEAVGSHFLDSPNPLVQIARIDCANEVCKILAPPPNSAVPVVDYGWVCFDWPFALPRLACRDQYVN
jgi:thiol-disulfide isomerase/thioredoxin